MSPHSTSPPLRRRLIAAAGVVGLLTGIAVSAQPAAAEPGGASTGRYIVQLSELPASSYDGGVSGMASTRPEAGGKVDPEDPDVVRYRRYLRNKHDKLLSQAGNARKVYDLSLTFNGFVAEMSSADAVRLSRAPGVVNVSKDEIRKLDTVSTPEFLGLTKRSGLWNQLGGPGKNGAGKDVVVGVLDTGIWPENPSFAPLGVKKPPAGWNGVCQTGEEFGPDKCSDKIVGARYYTAGFGGPGAIKERFPSEYLSARDADGHGSHTSSTAAGNHGVKVTVDGAELGDASGMAPNARVAMYKVCWGSDAGGCPSSDSMKAIEDATADGVDVLNFSISGSRTSVLTPVELQFLFAADAGVFVATSAGNSGPGASTVAHNSPWVTTVAAGTHDRVLTADVALGNGQTYTGPGAGAAVPSSDLVLSSAAGKADADPDQVRLCYPGTLDSAKAAGKIVVCDRGVIARVDKSLAVKQAGGVGTVLVNTSPSSLNGDLHFVPTVHLNETDGSAVKAYAADAGATASLSKGERDPDATAPGVASFSSRGPALSGDGDLLKPDIMAPGVDVLAAVAPPGNHGRDFDLLSGTSMSSPHIAGLAALVRHKHPKWSPMAVKSALMTTAAQRDNKGQPLRNDTGTAASPLDYGSGHVAPNAAAGPGLVYDSGFAEWLGYVCGVGELPANHPACEAYGVVDPSDLNQPNIAVGDLAGTQTVTRTVTNVTDRTSSYAAKAAAPAGVEVKVSPQVLKLKAGESATYQVKLTRTSAALDKYAFGSLTWDDGSHAVRSQIAVRPIALAAPAEISASGASGEQTLSVTPGFSGTLTATPAGLVAGNVNTATLKNPTGGSFDTDNPTVSDHTAKFTVTVPAGTTTARFATFDADVTTGTDLDVFVFKAGTNQLVGSSASGTSEEIVTPDSPAAGGYDVYVDLWALAPGETEHEAMAFDWSVGSAAAGNLAVTPESQSVTTGSAASLTVSWNGLAAGTRYLGRISYGDGSDPVGSTLVYVTA